MQKVMYDRKYLYVFDKLQLYMQKNIIKVPWI